MKAGPPQAKPTHPNTFRHRLSQANPGQLHEIFRTREKFTPREFQMLLAYLHGTFPVRFGNEEAAWEEYLEKARLE